MRMVRIPALWMAWSAVAVLMIARPVWAQPQEPAQREEAIRGYAQAIRGLLAKGVLPIIDVEHHWGGKKSPEELLEKMDRNGVALTWLGQNERNGSAYGLEAWKLFPDRIVPVTIHGDGPRWHGRDPSLLDELAADARSGRYWAMGEFEGRHYVSGTNDRDVHTPVDSPGFEAVFRLSAETGLPFLVHHEAEDALLPEMERMLARYPRAAVIWCHVGRNRDRASWTVLSRPDGVRRFLAAYPNLTFDLNQAAPGGRHRGTGQVDAVLYDAEEGRGGMDQPPAMLRSEWLKLFEEHPERFVIGSDVNTGRWDKYDQVFRTFRGVVLPRLSRSAAERIAWKNAWRLMTGREWVD